MSTHLHACQSVCLFVCLLVCLLVCLFIRSSVMNQSKTTPQTDSEHLPCLCLSGQSRGFAFVEFLSQDDAERLIRISDVCVCFPHLDLAFIVVLVV